MGLGDIFSSNRLSQPISSAPEAIRKEKEPAMFEIPFQAFTALLARPLVPTVEAFILPTYYKWVQNMRTAEVLTAVDALPAHVPPLQTEAVTFGATNPFKVTGEAWHTTQAASSYTQQAAARLQFPPFGKGDVKVFCYPPADTAPSTRTQLSVSELKSKGSFSPAAHVTTDITVPAGTNYQAQEQIARSIAQRTVLEIDQGLRSIPAHTGIVDSHPSDILRWKTYPNSEEGLRQAKEAVKTLKAEDVALFQNPTQASRQARWGYALAHNDLFFKSLRSVHMYGTLFAMMSDLISVIHIWQDPIQDRWDKTFVAATTAASLSSFFTGCFGFLDSPGNRLLRLTPFIGSLATLGFSTKHFYDDLRDAKLTSQQEKNASIFELLGAITTLGGGFLMTAGATTAIPVSLFMFGTLLCFSCQLGHKEAVEDRLSKQFDKAFAKKDVAELNRLLKDERNELDDDTLVKFFENSILKKGSYYTSFWKSDACKPLRMKMIQEFGGEGLFSYMGDDEAAYRLIIAQEESKEVLMHVMAQMDADDGAAYDALAEKLNYPSYNELRRQVLEFKDWTPKQLPPEVLSSEIPELSQSTAAASF